MRIHHDYRATDVIDCELACLRAALKSFDPPVRWKLSGLAIIGLLLDLPEPERGRLAQCLRNALP